MKNYLNFFKMLDEAFVSFSFIFETEHHNGVAELLEILGR